jgi:hypothetical protein
MDPNPFLFAVSLNGFQPRVARRFVEHEDPVDRGADADEGLQGRRRAGRQSEIAD